MITALEHLAIASDDSASLARWYCEVLGFKMVYASEKDRIYFVSLPRGDTLEIMASSGAARVDHAPKDPGLRHIALEVDDFDSTYQELQAKGIVFQDIITTPDGDRLVFFADPDGNLLHLVWRRRPFVK